MDVLYICKISERIGNDKTVSNRVGDFLGPRSQPLNIQIVNSQTKFILIGGRVKSPQINCTPNINLGANCERINYLFKALEDRDQNNIIHVLVKKVTVVGLNIHIYSRKEISFQRS